MSKTYRYTLIAHQEVDVCADNKGDADKKAEQEWVKLFGNKSLFGDVELVKELDNE